MSSWSSAASLLNPNFGFGTGGFGQGTWGNAPAFLQPLGYYTGILTSQYAQSPNWLAWLTAALTPLDQTTYCLAMFGPSFDLDGATGAQLNALGQIIGQGRTVPFQPSDSVSPVLDDTTYRLLLKARIAQNNWDGTIDSLQAIWQNLFPGGKIVVQDAQNMSASIILTGAFSSILVDLIQNGMIVPRPEGVLYNYVVGNLPAFGFDQSNTYIAGFDTGHFA